MGLLKEFGVEPVLLAAQVVNFTILLLILKKLLYQPVLTLLEERKKRIADSLIQAEKIKSELEIAEQTRQQVITEARDNAANLIEEGRKEAEKLLLESRESAKKEAQLILKKAQDSMNMEKQTMKKELQKEVLNFVVTTANKVLGKVINQDLQKKITKEAMEEMK